MRLLAISTLAVVIGMTAVSCGKKAEDGHPDLAVDTVEKIEPIFDSTVVADTLDTISLRQMPDSIVWLKDTLSFEDNPYETGSADIGEPIGASRVNAVLNRYEGYVNSYEKVCNKLAKGELGYIYDFDDLYYELEDIESVKHRILTPAQQKRLQRLITRIDEATAKVEKILPKARDYQVSNNEEEFEED